MKGKERVVRSGHYRLASLWLSQVSRIMADNCLRVFVVLELAGIGAAERNAAWHLVSALLVLPAVFFSPFNGALSNSLPKRWVLVGSAAYCFSLVLGFGLYGGPWLACWGLVAVGAAIYSPARYALLPAAAEETQVPLTRVNGWIEMGAVSAIVIGLGLGGYLHDSAASPEGAAIRSLSWHGSLPAAVAVAVLLNGVGLLAAFPVRFRTDLRRPEPLGQALAGFFRDSRRILRQRESRACLLGLAYLRGVVTAMTGGVLACTLTRQAESGQGIPYQELLWSGAWILIGVAAGSLLAGVQGHPFRALGLVPVGATGLLAGLLGAASTADDLVAPWLCLTLGIMGGLINVPLSATYQASLPANARGNGMAVRNLTDHLFMSAMSLLMTGLAYSQVLTPAGQLWLVALLAAGAAALSWWLLIREFLEQVTELVVWPLYRVRAHGPGVACFPRHGPVLVIANHAAWLDPLWLGKVLPRGITPMMTSTFYDLPVLRWLMAYVVRAIRVEASNFRREIPEVEDAVAVLDRGGCLVVFPEGWLRRREEQPLRNFGQGVWHILQRRPATPVVVCWIEGGFGSYTSYYGGRPTVNKRLDWWRPIDIVLAEPHILDPALLADRRATRAYLMCACLDARRYLGLESPAEPDWTEEPLNEAADER